MQIHLNPRNVRLAGALHGYVAEKIMRMEDIASNVVGGLHAAIHPVSEKLAGQLRIWKTRLGGKRHISSKEGR